jgi:hypothetical protein
VFQDTNTGDYYYTGKEDTPQPNLVKTIAKLVDNPITTLTDAIMPPSSSTTPSSNSATPAPAPDSSSTVELAAASAAPSVGAPARKDLLTEMDTSTELVEEEKPEDNTNKYLLIAAVVAGLGYYLYTTQKKR